MNATLTHPRPELERPAPSAYGHLWGFVVAILSVGAVRFGLSVSGVADSAARWASMTAVIVAAVVYFAGREAAPKQRLAIAYALIAPYMLVEIAGIGYQWATGEPMIFQSAPYSLGFDIEAHFWGHVVGGLTWEPWILFVLLYAVAGALRIARDAYGRLQAHETTGVDSRRPRRGGRLRR